MPDTQAHRVLAVGLATKPVGKPDAGNRHVRFDERGGETGQLAMPHATAPFLDSTVSAHSPCRRQWICGQKPMAFQWQRECNLLRADGIGRKNREFKSANKEHFLRNREFFCAEQGIKRRCRDRKNTRAMVVYDAALSEGVRLIEEREKRLALLDAALERGLADIDAGRTHALDEVADEPARRYGAAHSKAARRVTPRQIRSGEAAGGGLSIKDGAVSSWPSASAIASPARMIWFRPAAFAR